MREVAKQDANLCVIFSDPCSKQVINKFYFDAQPSESANAVVYLCGLYPGYFSANTRIDIAKVIDGAVIGE